MQARQVRVFCQHAGITAVPALTLIALLVFSSASGVAMGTFTKTIEGTVFDQLGVGVAGANVTVNIWVGDWPNNFGILRSSHNTTTNLQGFYEVSFDGNEWEDHYIIEVLATHDTTMWREIAEVDDQLFQTIDVDSVYIIPEFDSPLALVLAVSLSAALVAVARRPRRK